MAFKAVAAGQFGLSDHRSLLQYSVQVTEMDTLQVISDPDGIMGREIGSGLWTAATELNEFFRRKSGSLLQGQTVLELGAGIGFLGQVLFSSFVCIASMSMVLAEHDVLYTGTHSEWMPSCTDRHS